MLGIEFLALPIRAYQLGANSVEIGLLGGLSSALYSFMPLFAGRLGDRVGKKLPIRAFLFGYPLITLSYFITRSLYVMMMVRLLEGIAWAFYWPSLEALSASLGGRKAIRTYNLSWSLGALLGPVAGGLAISALSAKGTFLVMAEATIALAAASLLLMPPEGQPQKEKEEPPMEIDPIYLVAVFAVGFSITGFLSYFPVLATRMGISPPLIGAFEGNLSFWRIFALFATGSALERVEGRKRTLVVSSSAAVFLIPTAVAFGVPVWWVVTSLLGFISGMGYGISIHTILESAGARGKRAGIFESTLGIGSLLGPMAMGYVSSLLFSGPYGPFLAMGISVIPLCAGIAILKRSGTRLKIR